MSIQIPDSGLYIIEGEKKKDKRRRKLKNASDIGSIFPNWESTCFSEGTDVFEFGRYYCDCLSLPLLLPLALFLLLSPFFFFFFIFF